MMVKYLILSGVGIIVGFVAAVVAGSWEEWRHIHGE